MGARLHWEIEDGDNETVVRLHGSVDEDSDFNAILETVKARNRLCLNLAKIERINSCGIREWVNFIRAIPDTSRISFEACSPVIVSQMNVISNFVGSATVRSIQAPFVCEECGHEENVLLEVQAGTRPKLADVFCPKCSAKMEFDDLEDSYFVFLT